MSSYWYRGFMIRFRVGDHYTLLNADPLRPSGVAISAVGRVCHGPPANEEKEVRASFETWPNLAEHEHRRVFTSYAYARLLLWYVSMSTSCQNAVTLDIPALKLINTNRPPFAHVHVSSNFEENEPTISLVSLRRGKRQRSPRRNC